MINKFYCERDPGTFFETSSDCHLATTCVSEDNPCTDTGMLSNCWTLNNDGTETGQNCNCASNVICDPGCCSNADAICYIPTEYEESLYELGSSGTICCEVGYLDECGVCGGNNYFNETGIPGPNQDCAGTCGGVLELDECGICDGPGYTQECCDGTFICDEDLLGNNDVCPTCGCKDPLAANYNPNATIELLDEFGYSECQYTACFDGTFDENGNLTEAGGTHPGELTIDPENINHNPLSVYDWFIDENVPVPTYSYGSGNDNYTLSYNVLLWRHLHNQNNGYGLEDDPLTLWIGEKANEGLIPMYALDEILTSTGAWSFVQKSSENMGHALPLDTSNDKWWYNQTLNFVYQQGGLIRADNTKGFLRRNYQGRTSENPFTWEIFCNNEVAELITNAGIINPQS